MIIDSHVHLGKSEKINRYFTFENFFELMKKEKINQSIVMPNISSDLRSSFLNYSFMDEYLFFNKRNKNVYFPLILIDPNDMKTLTQINSFSHLIYGVKYHPSVCGVEICDERMFPFLDILECYRTPILVHCGRNKLSHISNLIKVAKKYKSLTFIGAHMGGNASDLIEEAIGILYNDDETPNIFLDTSAGKLPYLIEKAVKKLGSEKILFGSDEPYADLRVSKYCLEICDISDQEKENIFYENSKRIFRIV